MIDATPTLGPYAQQLNPIELETALRAFAALWDSADQPAGLGMREKQVATKVHYIWMDENGDR